MVGLPLCLCVLAAASGVVAQPTREKGKEESEEAHELKNAMKTMLTNIYEYLVEPNNRTKPQLVGQWDFPPAEAPTVKVDGHKIRYKFTGPLEDAQLRQNDSLRDGLYTYTAKMVDCLVTVGGLVDTRQGCLVRTLSLHMGGPFVLSVLPETLRAPPSFQGLPTSEKEKKIQELQTRANAPANLSRLATSFNAQFNENGPHPVARCTEAFKEFLAKQPMQPSQA